MNRRKFLSYIGCSCCGFILNSCTSAPITERKQLKLVSEAKLNAKAAEIFEKVKQKDLILYSGLIILGLAAPYLFSAFKVQLTYL